jgi:hypothetical protein
MNEKLRHSKCAPLCRKLDKWQLISPGTVVETSGRYLIRLFPL